MTTEQRQASKNSGMLTISQLTLLVFPAFVKLEIKTLNKEGLSCLQSVRKTTLIKPQEKPEGKGDGIREGWLSTICDPAPHAFSAFHCLSSLLVQFFTLTTLLPASLFLFHYSPHPLLWDSHPYSGGVLSWQLPFP